MHEHDDLILAQLEGRLDAAGVARFQKLFRNDPAFVRRYAAMSVLNEHLSNRIVMDRPLVDDPAGELTLTAPAHEPELTISGHGTHPTIKTRRRPWLANAAPAMLAATIVVASALLALYFLSMPAKELPTKSGDPVATLIWADGPIEMEDPVTTGEKLRPQTIRTTDGETEFLTNSGAGVRLQGSCEFILHSPNAVTLTRSSAVFECPPSAMGYTVHLPHGAKVVDLGTRFEVVAHDHGGSRVRVNSGRVKLYLPKEFADPEFQEIELLDGEAAWIDPQARAVHVIKTLPDAPHLPHSDYVTIATYQADGDPVGQDWKLAEDGSAISLDRVGEFDTPETWAWSVNDDKGSGRAFYRFDLTPEQAIAAMERGWQLDAIISVADVGVPSYSRMVGFIGPGVGDEGRSFAVLLGSTPDGRLMVKNGDIEHPYVVGPSQAKLFHTISMMYDPKSGLASLSIDGQTIPLAHDGIAKTPPYGADSLVRFGSATTDGTGHAHYRYVRFAIPGPPTQGDAEDETEN